MEHGQPLDPRRQQQLGLVQAQLGHTVHAIFGHTLDRLLQQCGAFGDTECLLAQTAIEGVVVVDALPKFSHLAPQLRVFLFDQDHPAGVGCTFLFTAIEGGKQVPERAGETDRQRQCQQRENGCCAGRRSNRD